MKTLLLLRHAKSSWDDASLEDFDRPLAPRGERDAPVMAKALRQRGPVPDLVVSSPALRARATVEAFTRAAGLEAAQRFDQSFYGAAAGDLLRAIRRLPERHTCVLVVGHNPGLEELLSRLSGARDTMPTTALACIDFEVERWKEVSDGTGTLRWLLTPKRLDKNA